MITILIKIVLSYLILYRIGRELGWLHTMQLFATRTHGSHDIRGHLAIPEVSSHRVFKLLESRGGQYGKLPAHSQGGPEYTQVEEPEDVR